MANERATSRGMRFHRRGKGRPLVFLHGWCLNRQLWTYAEEEFSRAYDVITPDLPGFGTSADLSGPYDFERFGKDVTVLLAELALKDVVLVGFAFGAAVALAAAARDKSRIAAIVSVALPSATASPYDKMPRAMRRDWPAFARKSAEVLFRNPQSEATIGRLERMFGGTDLTVAIDVVQALGALEPEKMVTAAGVRTHFIHGRQDEVAPIALGEACAKLAPDGSLEIIEECGHLTVLDRKAEFHASLKAYLDRLN
jgi:pimeloyl-ACP methyl ester carboxylesterase